jgi:hypothetical protein
MIYDFNINTGSVVSPLDRRNNQIAPKFGTIYPLSSDLVTGSYVSRVSANGQTLHETAALLDTSLGYDVFYGSGDYFVNTGISSSKPVRLTAHTGIQASTDSLLYDIRSGVATAFAITDNPAQMGAEITGSIALNLPNFSNDLGNLEYFLNGQKIYSGQSYTISGNSFIYSEQITGKIQAIPKLENVQENTGSSAYIYGSDFIRGRNNVYINGMEQKNLSWLECSTGVTVLDKNVRGILLNTPSSGTAITL